MTLARRTEPLRDGLPHTIALDAEVSLVAVLPNGLAVPWLQADPLAIVSSSRPEGDPHVPGAAPPPRAPLRLLVLTGPQPVAAVPLVAGLHRTLPDHGGPDGARLELEIIGWEVHAGTLRGAGDFGSFVDLAWRRVAERSRPTSCWSGPPSATTPAGASRSTARARDEGSSIRSFWRSPWTTTTRRSRRPCRTGSPPGNTPSASRGSPKATTQPSRARTRRPSYGSICSGATPARHRRRSGSCRWPSCRYSTSAARSALAATSA